MKSNFNHLRHLTGADKRGQITKTTNMRDEYRMREGLSAVHAAAPESADKESSLPPRRPGVAQEIGALATIPTIPPTEVVSAPN